MLVLQCHKNCMLLIMRHLLAPINRLFAWVDFPIGQFSSRFCDTHESVRFCNTVVLVVPRDICSDNRTQAACPALATFHQQVEFHYFFVQDLICYPRSQLIDLTVPMNK